MFCKVRNYLVTKCSFLFKLEHGLTPLLCLAFSANYNQSKLPLLTFETISKITHSFKKFLSKLLSPPNSDSEKRCKSKNSSASTLAQLARKAKNTCSSITVVLINLLGHFCCLFFSCILCEHSVCTISKSFSVCEFKDFYVSWVKDFFFKIKAWSLEMWNVWYFTRQIIWPQ